MGYYDYWLVGIVAIAAWIALGLPSGPLAERRGRHGVGWFFLGLLFGPIATLIVWRLPSRRRPALWAWGGRREAAQRLRGATEVPASPAGIEAPKASAFETPPPVAPEEREAPIPEAPVEAAIAGEPAAKALEAPTPPTIVEEPEAPAIEELPPAVAEGPKAPAEPKNPFYFFDGGQARDLKELYEALAGRQDYWGYIRSGDVERWLAYLGEGEAAALAARFQGSPQEFVAALGERLRGSRVDHQGLVETI